jgi:epoxyqueuosine reductase
MTLGLEDREWITQRAVAAGFDLAGVADVPDDAAVEDARFAAFVDAGHAGEMEYLKRADDAGEYVRGDLRRAIPWARSVIVCAVNYNAEAPLSVEAADPRSGWIARYAWSGRDGRGSDYHNVLLPKLRVVEAEIRERFEGCETRCYVDTGPIVERGFAARAGVGWIGKNTCVINQKQGSWLLLGVIVTSLELAKEALSVVAADRCGSCTRCIDACPTDALIGQRQMDASRCIAYLTIEKKGSIDESLRALMGRQVFGCDICQDVCPWNRKAPVGLSGALPARQELVNPALEWLASMDGAAFNRMFRGSPLERTRRKRVLRNVAIAMGNSGCDEFLERLDGWADGEDAVLAEAAGWAARRLRQTEVPTQIPFGKDKQKANA